LLPFLTFAILAAKAISPMFCIDLVVLSAISKAALAVSNCSWRFLASSSVLILILSSDAALSIAFKSAWYCAVSASIKIWFSPAAATSASN